jgi:F-type H+-transporting ATPase subunit alpha
VCILYAVINGYLNDISINLIGEFEKRLYTFMEEKYYDVLSAIRKSGKLEPETEEMLKKALTELHQEFVPTI